MIEIINEPINDRFFNLVSDSKKNIRLCAPYVKEPIVKKIYDNKKSSVKIDLISNFSLPNFYKRSSDIEAFDRLIINKDKVYNCQTLHAKFYIFDDKCAIITSANLTPSGFEKNIEYGVIITDNLIVSQIVNDFKSLCNNENTRQMNNTEIIKIKTILNNLPTYKDLDISKYNLYTEVDSILDVDMNLIKSNLNNGQNKVVEIIELINSDEFTSADVYSYENVFAEAFPKNKTAKNSIRRNLQELRDLGLIKFYGNGMYKKLW